MITDALLTGFTLIITGILELMPTVEVPSWLDTLPGQSAALGGQMAGFGNWIPWSVLLQVTSTLVGLFAIVAGARLALWVWGKIPVLGGGS